MTVDSPDVYDSSAPAPPTPPSRLQLSRLLSTLGRPRDFSFNTRVFVTVATTVIAFWPVWASNLQSMLAGSPMAYLFLLPVWSVMITYSLDRVPRGKEINDAEFDRIVAVVVGGVGIVCVSAAIPRLPGAAAFWHADVIPPLIWMFSVSIMAFGIRRVVRDYLTWIFVAVCFPPNFLLFGAVLGGTTFAYGSLTVFHGAMAAFLALRGSSLKWWVPPAFLVIGVAGTWMLKEQSPPVVYLLPTIVLTTAVIVLVARRVNIPARISLPQRSPLAIVLAFFLALVVLTTSPRPLSLSDTDRLIWAQSDWIDNLQQSGVAVGPPQTFDWGPRFMGDDGSVVRHRIQIGDEVAFLDVFSSPHFGRFASFRRGIWYASAPPAVLGAEYRGNGREIIQFGELSNQLETVKKPGQSLWAARNWAWRTKVGSDTQYQVIYLLGSREDGAPDSVPEPASLNYANTVLDPIEWLMIAPTSEQGTRTTLEPRLTDMAEVIVESAQDRQ